jgi:hypothetical protein
MQAAEITERVVLPRSTIRFGPRIAALIQNTLIKGKDFDDHVEAHQSTCDTQPAS